MDNPRLVKSLSENLGGAGYQVEYVWANYDASKFAIALSGASLVILSSSVKFATTANKLSTIRKSRNHFLYIIYI